MPPLISVIVPVYNVEQYLDRCVESIVNQTYLNLEIILIDDGSPDNCPKICDKWAKKDSRIIVIHKENGGLSDARNAGLDIASGDYISFIDSDDWIDLHTFSLVIEKMLQTHSKIGAFDYVTVMDDTIPENKSDEYILLNPEEGILCTIKNELIKTVVWNKIYHNEILKDLRFEVGKLNEDEFFTYKALDKTNKIVFLYRPCYYYFQRHSSIMSNYTINRLDMLDGVYDRMIFTKEFYPNIYPEAKLCFCSCCIYHFQMLLKYKNIKFQRIGKQKVIDYRKRIRVHYSEIKKCSMIKKITMMISNTSIGMMLICSLRNLLNYGL